MEHQFNTKWYASDEVADEDSWFCYLHRSLHHLEGEDTRFRDSSWSYSQEDADLHDKIIDRLYLAPEIDASLIKITVARRSVYLTGCVKTLEEKSRITDLVKGFEDVWDVTNILVLQ